jgi:predicted anti-sigma-YlaC factor YlaD
MDRCEYCQQLLSQRMDEPLPSVQQAELKRHLESCENCREFMAELRRQQRMFAGLPELTSDDVTVPAAETRRGGVLARLWRVRLAIPVPLAAALLAAVIGWELLGAPDITGPEVKTTAVERKVTVIHLEPVSAVRLGD